MSAPVTRFACVLAVAVQLLLVCAPLSAQRPEPPASNLDPDDSADAYVLRRFGTACRGYLHRLDGIDFGWGRVAYSCPVFFPRQHFEKSSPWREDFKAMHEAFGTELPLVPGQLIGATNIRSGESSIAVIIARRTGHLDTVILSPERLNQEIEGVMSQAGAVQRAALHATAPAGLPDTGEVQADATGWTIKGLEIVPNCERSIVRDLRVHRSGRIEILSEGPGSGFSCLD